MADKEPVKMTKDDLDKFIEVEVGKAVEKGTTQVKEWIDGLRKELLSSDTFERGRESRKKAEADFAGLSSAEQGRKIGEFRSALFDVNNRGKEKATLDESRGAGVNFTRFAPLFLRAKGDLDRVKALASEAGHMDIVETVERVLQAGDFDAGGALIPEVYANDFISYLYDVSVVRLAGARTVDISERGNLIIGRMNQTATAYWVGEGDAGTSSEQKYGQLKLDAKKLTVIVPVSNDLIRIAVGGFQELVRDDMVTVAALKQDLAFLRGDGTANQPKGILNYTKSANKFASAGTSHANIVKDLVKAEYKVDSSNVLNVNRAWFMHSRAKAGLMLTLTADGQYAFLPELMMGGSVMGAPVFCSNQLPTNLDTSTAGNNNETDVYYCEMSQMVIGDAGTVELEETNSDSDDFTKDQRKIRAIHHVDFVQRHDSAAGIIRQTIWGASLDA